MSEQKKPIKPLYCIAGIAAASESFARGSKENQNNLITQMKEKHIPESDNLIREDDLYEIISGKCASHCVPALWEKIIGKYTKLGYSFSENCLRCSVTLVST